MCFKREMGQNELQGRRNLTQPELILYQAASPKDQIGVTHTHICQHLLHGKWSTPYEYYTLLSVLKAFHLRDITAKLLHRCHTGEEERDRGGAGCSREEERSCLCEMMA